MDQPKTILLNHKQAMQRINRIAYQIYEDNASEKELIVAGILSSGYEVAKLLSEVLQEITPFKIHLLEVKLDKHSQVASAIKLSLESSLLPGKSIVLVDDVLNSGKTMMYALKPFLESDIKKIRTVVLVDRNHRRYPIAADYVGLSLATTMQEHVTVEFGNQEINAFLS